MSTQDLTLAVPGVVHVGKTDTPEGGVVSIGQAAGYIAPQGIREWSHELSVIARKDLTDTLREQLGVTLPEHRIAKSRHPLAYRAAETSPLLAVISEIAPQLVEKGVRVHTIGFDRVTGGFMYFAEGGTEEPVRIHGDLLEMLEPALAGGSSNEDIERYLERFVDRLLQHFSKGVLTELGVELANALPRLATDARGLQGVDLDAFEAEAGANAEKSKQHEEGGKKLADALAAANGSGSVKVPLFGEAKGSTQPAMEIVVAGSPMTLPARTVWTVSGTIREEAKPAPAPVSVPKPVAVTPSPQPAVVRPAAASTSRPVPVTPSPAPAIAKAPAAASTSKPIERSVTPAPGKIPAALAAKPVERAPVSKPVEPAPVSKPEGAPVVVVRPVQVIGVGEAPMPAASAPVPEPVVEASPEPKPEPVVEARPEPKPEPVVEARPKPAPEPKAEAKPVKREEKKVAVEKKAAEKIEKAAPPPPEKSNTMMYVIIAILVVAAIAYFAMKKH